MVTKTMRFLAIEMIVFPTNLIAYERVSYWKSSERMLGLSVFISPSSWDLQPTYLLKYLVTVVTYYLGDLQPTWRSEIK